MQLVRREVLTMMSWISMDFQDIFRENILHSSNGITQKFRSQCILFCERRGAEESSEMTVRR